MTDLKLSDLGYFTGTEQYHSMGPLFRNIVVTDGVKYVMDNGYSWFVTDALAIVINKLKDQPFLVVSLKLGKGDSGKMQIDDGNGKVLYTQKYEYTDAESEVKLYFTDNVMMVTSEY
jgi:hypothetical protein